MGLEDTRDTRALILHPDITSNPDRREAVFALEEAVSLAAALPGLTVVSAEIIRLPNPSPGLLFGKGEIAPPAEDASPPVALGQRHA